jgi:hypothetical protein
MVAARVLAPDSKLATTRWWHTTTLAEEFGASEATEDDLYAAMDWLIDRQGAMEKKLAQRHLTPGGLALYDVTSTYLEGGACPLGAFGYNRDGKRGKKQVNYGLLTDARGCPVAMSVYPGDTGDAGTLLGELKKVREGFGIGSLVVVGDRGMVGKREVEELARQPGMDWISALKGSQVRTLLGTGAIQLGLFDERGLYEMEHPDYPGERLVVCRNPLVGERRAAVRESLIEATTKELEAVRGRVERGTLVGKDKIGLRVGRVVNRYHVAKHFDLEVGEETFTFRVNAERVAAEAALDGIYVIRTSLPREGMDAAGGGAELQASRPGGEGVSLLEDARPRGAADLPPPRAAGTGAPLPLSSRVLRGLAPAGGVAGAPLSRRGGGGEEGERPDCPCQAIPFRSPEGPAADASRRESCGELPHPAGEPLDRGAQHLPPRRRHGRRAHVHPDDRAVAQATAGA